jgi:hypothetical protein
LLVGSAITFIARDKTHGEVRRMEMDPKYAYVMVKRWQDFTQGKRVWRRSNQV